MMAPILTLLLWTLAMLVWLYIARFRAMMSLRLKPQDVNTAQKLKSLPESVQWPADNYANLLQQPLLFYVLCLAIQLTGQVDDGFRIFAWIYVGLRILHSLIHAILNLVMLRFMFFISASGLLAYMTLRLAFVVWDR